MWQFRFIHSWIPSLDVKYDFGIDGISLLLILLTTFMGIIAVVSSFAAIDHRQKEYYILLLLLQTGMIGTFCALDFFLFYVFWEIMLVPMYFIIGIWGGPRKLYAAIKFFLYTLSGSVVMLLSILALYFFNSDGIPFLNIKGLGNAGDVLRAAVPPDRTPDPADAAVLDLPRLLPRLRDQGPDVPVPHLASRRARRGANRRLDHPRRRPAEDGNLRLRALRASDSSRRARSSWLPWVVALSIIGIIYGALVSLVQKDMKKLVAYSSVSHLGFVMLGMFALNPMGLKGSVLQMINHGISTGALFLLVGIIYERRHTRMIAEYGGLAKVMPVYATLFLIAALSSMGLPALNGFIGEFTILLGAANRSIVWASFASVGIVLGAAYLLWLYQRVFWGPLDNPANKNLLDVNKRELGLLLVAGRAHGLDRHQARRLLRHHRRAGQLRRAQSRSDIL